MAGGTGSDYPIPYILLGEQFGNNMGNLDVQLQAAAIGATATILAAFFGFGAVILQMRSQSKQSRQNVLDAERRKLKSEMYEAAVQIIRRLVDDSIELSTKLRSMKLELEVAARAHAIQIGYQIPRARYPDISSLYEKFSNSALQFIFLVENRRIFDPRILIFRTAILASLHETRDLLFSKFFLHVIPTLPVVAPSGELFPYTPPAIESALKVGILADQFINELDQVIAYAEDFSIELQNLLLGDLFPNRIAHRTPLDPKMRVITLADADQLETWFSENTEWGKQFATHEAATKAKFTAADPILGK